MTFSQKTSHEMARIADLAYNSDIEVRFILDLWEYDLIASPDIEGTQAFMAISKDKKTVVVVFRGTETTKIQDWITDLKVRKVSAGRWMLRVHRGFLEAMRQVGCSLEDLVRKAFVNGAKTLYIVGHSMGAALAALFAFFHCQRLDPQVYLFGCPRIGGVKFAKEYNLTLGNNTWRFTNHRDIITHTPCFWWNYRHIGRSVYYTASGERLHEPGFFRRVKEWFKGGGNTVTRLIGSVHDHGEYVRLTAETGFGEVAAA